MGPSAEDVLTIYLNGSAPLNKIVVMPIYDKKKNTKKSSSPEPRKL